MRFRFAALLPAGAERPKNVTRRALAIAAVA